MTDTKPKTRRQMIDQARATASAGEWDDVLTINQNIIDRFPKDADAYNRLGRAHLELRQFGSAYDSYSAALKIDPANMIARRNLHRLELLRRQHPSDEVGGDGVAPLPEIPQTNVFIEEVGKTWVDELVNAEPLESLAEVSSGERLYLEIDGDRILVKRKDGHRLGEVDAKTAGRLIQLIQSGNRYDVYALGLSRVSLRVILREVYKDPAQAGKVSFPRQISQTRAYLRDRDLLRQRDEADFYLLDDDDEELFEEETGASASEEDDTAEAEADAFEEEVVVQEDEEPSI
jgi:hypothetical protein